MSRGLRSIPARAACWITVALAAVLLWVAASGGAAAGDATGSRLRFSHAEHGEERGATCDRCHGASVEGEEPGRPIRGECDACHAAAGVPTACGLCHLDRPVAPQDHAGDWAARHGAAWRVGGPAGCAHCHRDPECQECHGRVALLPAPGDPQAWGAALQPSLGDGAGLVLARVHRLDYRDTHGVDALNKAGDCASCHDPVSDCALCHQELDPGGHALHEPAWHGGAGWGAIPGGVGTGGGRHGELGRRDMERCAVCHEIEGADPVCMRPGCHVDYDGVRGTDPRTHADGFGGWRESGVDFHGDPGAVCFHCHVRAGGEGFCQYCHREDDDR